MPQPDNTTLFRTGRSVRPLAAGHKRRRCCYRQKGLARSAIPLCVDNSNTAIYDVYLLYIR